MRKTFPNDLAKKLTKRELFALVMLHAQVSNGLRSDVMRRAALDYADELIEILNKNKHVKPEGVPNETKTS